MKAVCHSDGSVTYWSVHCNVWVHRSIQVPDQELAAMSEGERKRVSNHLKRANKRKLSS